VALLLLALASLLVRRGHTRDTSRHVTSASVAPISVYLDLENQQFSGGEVKPFISYLRERIREYTGGERADLFLYCDASSLANTAAYQALHSYGFRPMDVPHRRFNEAAAQRGDANVVHGNLKNFVDMELALHTYRRALVDTQPRHIILITSDYDFIPLIRRLRELGHDVHLWAREMSHYMKALDSTLGVHAYVFGDQFRRKAAEIAEPNASQGEPGAIGAIQAPPPQTRTVTKQARAASGRQNGQARSTVPAVAPSATIGEAIDATFRALAHTRRAFEKVPPPKATPTNHLYTALGNMEMNVLARLGYADPEGYTGKKRVGYWLDQLIALGVLSAPAPGDLPDHGPVDPAAAEHTLLAFLRFELCLAIAHAAAATHDERLPLDELCAAMRSNAPAGAPDPVSALRLLFTSGTGNAHLRHMRYLCQCAARYGMLTYAAISDTEIAAPVVRDAGTAAEAVQSPTIDRMAGMG
jgi:NYN domain-containing protein